MASMSRNDRLPRRNRRRIAIERDHIGSASQNGRCVTASSERSVENDFSRRRSQRLEHFGKKNRNVTN